MKKLLLVFVLMVALLAGCGSQAEPGVTVNPLPDTTMESLDNSTVAVSLEEGDAYLDDEGILQMDLQIYTHDKYDMADIAALKEGDVIVTYAEGVEVTSVEKNDSGLVSINGGEEAGGFDLYSDESGVYYRVGFDGVKDWYSYGQVTVRVSTEFEFRDNSDPEKGEVVYYPGSFLVDEVTDYNFNPNNTTVRIEDGQVVEMERIFTP